MSTSPNNTTSQPTPPDALSPAHKPQDPQHQARAIPIGLWLYPLGIGFVAVLAIMPLDRWIDASLHTKSLGGDVRRELQALQQFGQGTISVLIGITIFLLDPKNRVRLVDWVVSAAVLGVVATGLKMFIGRARPRLRDPFDPDLFLGPFGKYPLGGKAGEINIVHSWELWQPKISDLWSMPSSHTVFAVLCAFVLSKLYPKIAPVVIFLAVLVGFCRVLFDSHYASDVAAGAAVGYAVTAVVWRWSPGNRWFGDKGGRGANTPLSGET